MSDLGRSRSALAVYGALLALIAFPVAADAAPEWIDPQRSVQQDIRAGVSEGIFPLEFLSAGEATRTRLAAALDTARAIGSPHGARVRRELATELEAIGRGVGDGAISPAATVNLDPGSLFLRPYLELEGRWREAGPTSWSDGPRLGVRGVADLSPRFSLQLDLFAGRIPGGRRFADALVAHTDFILSAESAYAAYSGSIFGVRVGRMRHSFGPGLRGNLLLSPSAPPFDQLEYTLRWRRLRFVALTGTLAQSPIRNIAFHRLEWDASPRLLVALSEGAIFPGDAYQPLYLVGLMPYTLVERLHGQDGVTGRAVAEVRNNVLWQLDATLRTDSRSLLYAALLLDDVATESSDMPSRLGGQAGWETSRPLRGWWWGGGVEASKIYNYTYSVYSEVGCDCDWEHQGNALGYPDGPDVERIDVYARLSPNSKVDFQLTASHRDHGAGRLGAPWIRPQEGADRPTARRLSGTVERMRSLGLSTRVVPTQALDVTLGIERRRVDNEGNVPLSPVQSWSAHVALSAHR